MVRKSRKSIGGAKKRKGGKKHALSLLRASINAANTKSDLLQNLIHLKLYKSVTGSCFSISCVQYSECTQELLSWMMNLMEQNMAELYAACDWGWNLEEKRKELSTNSARFIIAHSEEGKPVAFSHFRFDMDHNASVVYCYELQVDKVAQKQGLAKQIMRIIELLCLKNNMSKVVLTVFKHNENACKFFASQGYETDETSPENYGVDAFYMILSKTKCNCFTSET